MYVGNKVVGVREGDILHKSVTNAQLLQRPPAIAWAEQVIADAEALGVKYLKVLHRETGNVYQVSMSDFKRLAFPIQRGGFERQLALPLRYWPVTPPGKPLTLPPEPPSPTPARLTVVAVQPTLL
jgi:hypothetical protein